MRISLNGRERDVADAVTVAELVAAEVGASRGSAAVVDGEVVPRSRWDAQRLTEGAVVEIVTAVQGG
jgi:sulfur carrier protein